MAPFKTEELIGHTVDVVEHADWREAMDWKAGGTNIKVYRNLNDKWVLQTGASDSWSLQPLVGVWK
jgi:hypothetical protein